jgi:hypothetical protein
MTRQTAGMRETSSDILLLSHDHVENLGKLRGCPSVETDERSRVLLSRARGVRGYSLANGAVNGAACMTRRVETDRRREMVVIVVVEVSKQVQQEQSGPG